MAPGDPNFTGRLYLDYTSVGTQHTVMLRLPTTSGVSDAVDKAVSAATVIATRMLSTDSVFAARYSDPGSDFTLPIAFTAVPGVIAPSGNTWLQDPESAFLSIRARSTTSGKRSGWQFYTPISTVGWPANNRFEPGESAPIDTFRINWTSVVEGTDGTLVPVVAIDDTLMQVYSYVNIALNSYWQRKQRISS